MGFADPAPTIVRYPAFKRHDEPGSGAAAAQRAAVPDERLYSSSASARTSATTRSSPSVTLASGPPASGWLIRSSNSMPVVATTRAAPSRSGTVSRPHLGEVADVVQPRVLTHEVLDDGPQILAALVERTLEMLLAVGLDTLGVEHLGQAECPR